MIYLHVPFCRSFCTYCDFYSRTCAGAESRQVQNFVRRVCAEAAARRDEIAAARAASVHTLYLGGGTPSVLSLDQLATIVDTISAVCRGEKHFSSYFQKNEKSEKMLFPAAGSASAAVSSDAPAAVPSAASAVIPSAAKESLFDEFTVEVNPDDIAPAASVAPGTPAVMPGAPSAAPGTPAVMPGTPAVMPGTDRASLPGLEYARGLRALGVNRISMGVQSWDDGILRWMNRRHDAAGARRAFAILREAGFDNISLDLIFGLSQLSDAVWEATIDETLALRPEHISAYQLSVEPGSALGRLARTGRYREIGDDAAARQYAMLCETLAAAGYVHYEVSNFALPGREAVHNSAYWRRLPYVGLGPAAHSFDGHTRRWNDSKADWFRPAMISAAPTVVSAAPTVVSGAPTVVPSAASVISSAVEKSRCETLTAVEAREEAIMLGLRTAAGIPASLLSAAPAAERLLAEGALVRLPGDRLRIPESRFFVSDDIISSLL